MADMTDEVYEILRAAVNLARFEQIRSLPTLKSRLIRRYPGRDTEVNEALFAWAEYTQSKGSTPATA